MTLESDTAPTPVALATIIRQVQARFIRGASITDVFEPVLDDILGSTQSEYGFIGEVLEHADDGHRFLRMYVLTDVSWDDASRDIFARHHTGERQVEFHNPNTLFGAALTSGEMFISNDPAHDPRRGGLPHGHRPMTAFAGVPLWHGGALVGMIGVANRPGGYQAAALDELQPLFATVASIIDSFRLTRALRQSEADFRTTIEAAAVGICHVGLDGRFLLVNSQLCQVLGRSAAELLDMRVGDITRADGTSPAALSGVDTQRLLDGEIASYACERRLVRADGRELWAAISVSLVRDAAGQPLHLINIVEDISARKQAEAAERANAAKTAFMSQMSHELRTPLNAVLGFAQLMQIDRSDPLSDGQRERLRHIVGAGEHLLVMINDILDLSRIEGGTLSLSLEPVALPRLVDESLALLSSAAQAAQVQVHVAASGEAAADTVRADRGRLRQVLVNLLSNAIKYNRPQGRVAIAWGRGSAPQTVALSVSDTGRGMSAEQLGHLYEPFNRLGAETSHIEGTGIGLVVTRRLAQMMGGTLHVESEPGVGSRFTVVLPAVASGEAERCAPSLDQGAPAEPESEAVLRHVLYVEDNMVNIELVRAMLALRPHIRLTVAGSGREALALARSAPPDLFLLDMHLGDMTGLALAEALAREPALGGVPRVALSADAMQASIDEALSAGFVRYLTKPVQTGRLLDCLDQVFAAAGCSAA